MTTATQTKMDRFIEEAARRLVSQFSNVDGDMVRAKFEEETKGDPFAQPMWSTLFKVEDGCDRSNIQKLMRSLMPDDEMSAIGCIIDNGIDLDLSKFYTCDQCGEGIAFEAQAVYDAGESGPENPCHPEAGLTVDEPALVDAARDAWADQSDDNYFLASCGWQDVGGTGILAIEVDGDLFLGVNGAGYSFYDSHWIPLYKALGYSWHVAGFREAMLHDAVSDLTRAVEKGNERAILRAARKVAKRQRARQNGGPLSKAEQAEAGAERS